MYNIILLLLLVGDRETESIEDVDTINIIIYLNVSKSTS